MTLKHIKFSDSPTMRELERLAAAKDEHKVAIASRIVKKASAEPMQSHEPTDDLFADLINLAIGLRDHGMVKQAEELELKITNYKIADVHLYRAHDEDGDDVINAAHRDGEVTIAPSSKGYGVIETQLTSHKKIVDIVNKKPTGKLANANKKALVDVAAALNMSLKKKA